MRPTLPVGAISGEKRGLHIIGTQLCIDCGVCGRVCAFAAVDNEAGQVVAGLKRKDWLKPVWEYDLCVACTICVSACPSGVIVLQPQGTLPYF